MGSAALDVLEHLDDAYGPTKHLFSQISNLDVACARTNTKVASVSDSLLTWVLHGYAHSCSDESGETEARARVFVEARSVRSRCW